MARKWPNNHTRLAKIVCRTPEQLAMLLENVDTIEWMANVVVVEVHQRGGDLYRKPGWPVLPS